MLASYAVTAFRPKERLPTWMFGQFSTDFTVSAFQSSTFSVHPVYSLNTCSSCQWRPWTPDVPRRPSASQSPCWPRVSRLRTHWKKPGPLESCYWTEPSCWPEHRSCGKPRKKVLSWSGALERAESPPHSSTANSTAGKSGHLPQALPQVNFIRYCFSSGNGSLVS